MSAIRIQPGERVLVVGLCRREHIARWAEAALLLAGVSENEDEIRAARREFASLDNVMFSPGNRHEIPWRDGWFTTIIDAEGGEPSPEMMRVLAPGGGILRLE